ncbi:MAG: FGGY-family carbohydrate kinase [Clostridia bacterium]|nr:FGGY-family carbohydrate kinase [Clostridia bacterium]
MRTVLGIDIGTTSVKAILVSPDGKIIDEVSAPHDLFSERSGWAEENANDWWNNSVRVVKELKSRAPDAFDAIECIGVTGMVPAIVMLDKDGVPIRKTIQQNDARSVEQIRRLTDEIDQDELYRLTGGYTNQQHVLPRMLWVKENEPENFSRLRWVLGSYDYIVYKLTGVLSVEMNWAVESGLFDIRKREWLTGQMTEYGFDPAWFPPANESMKTVGKVSDAAAKITGLKAGIPVIAGSADHVASTLSAGIIREGDLLIKFGGAGDILYCTEEIRTSPKLFFDYHIVPNAYLINGCMAASGSLVKWYLGDILGNYGGDALRELDEAASKLPPASDGLIILPYFLGEKTPIFDPEARGLMFGLTLSHTKAHIFRACLEAVIYGFKHHIDIIEEMGYNPQHIIATNGGSRSRFWCQIAADVLNREVRAYPSHPGSAMGVAFLAGMASGMFDSWEQIHLFLQDYRVFTPNPEAAKIYEKSYKIYRDLYRQTKPSCDAVARLY